MIMLHLLLVNDFVIVEENCVVQQVLGDLSGFVLDLLFQQECVRVVVACDGFNWGYDLFYYMILEGSYVIDFDGLWCTFEFCCMVQVINGVGLCVVLDVVFNYMLVLGQYFYFVFDWIVFGYYYWLNLVIGVVEILMCCYNMVVEHVMMRWLMVDLFVMWVREYKVDGFCFDFMGHYFKVIMLVIQVVFLFGMLFYGEGWSFGEVVGDARFVQVSQVNMVGIGIVTFSDCLCDAVCGGGLYDDDLWIQGFVIGLFIDFNGVLVNGLFVEQCEWLLQYQLLIELGFFGMLRDLCDVDYYVELVGYVVELGEVIVYVDVHDNETLFDALALKFLFVILMVDCVCMNTLALVMMVLLQSLSFWHVGVDLLCLKLLDCNSYDSGDWFNWIDWMGWVLVFGLGLLFVFDNQVCWEYYWLLFVDLVFKLGFVDIWVARR